MLHQSSRTLAQQSMVADEPPHIVKGEKQDPNFEGEEFRHEAPADIQVDVNSQQATFYKQKEKQQE